MNRRLLGYRSIDEYVEIQMQGNSRPGEDHYRHQAEHSLRLNYAGKYVTKSDPDMFWINGSFGVREVRTCGSSSGQDLVPDHGDEGRVKVTSSQGEISRG